jgi:hypothetical protein
MADSKLEGIKVHNALELKPAWLAQVVEDIVDPGRAIIDTHHHLWPKGGLIEYSLEDLWADTGSGHNIVKTVFMECHASYRTDGLEHLRSLGEVEYVRDIAERSAKDPAGRARIAAMVMRKRHRQAGRHGHARQRLRLDGPGQTADFR